MSKHEYNCISVLHGRLVSPLPIRRVTTRKALITSSSWRPLQRYHPPQQCRGTIYGTWFSLAVWVPTEFHMKTQSSRAYHSDAMQHTAIPCTPRCSHLAKGKKANNSSANSTSPNTFSLLSSREARSTAAKIAALRLSVP